jgi:hypothetical protein
MGRKRVECYASTSTIRVSAQTQKALDVVDERAGAVRPLARVL